MSCAAMAAETAVKTALRDRRKPVLPDIHPHMFQIVHVLDIIIPVIGIFNGKDRAAPDEDISFRKGFACPAFTDNRIPTARSGMVSFLSKCTTGA